MKTVLQKNDSRALSATQTCCWNLCCGELFSAHITSNCSCFCLYLFVSYMLTTFIWDLSLKVGDNSCLILMHKERKVSLEGLLCMESQVFSIVSVRICFTVLIMCLSHVAPLLYALHAAQKSTDWGVFGFRAQKLWVSVWELDVSQLPPAV